MKLIRSVIALMLISLSSPYFLHPAARAAAASDDDPITTAEEAPADAPHPPVPGGIAAAFRAMNVPEPVTRTPEHGWLSFVVQGEGIPPFPYTTDSQKLLRMAIERSNLGPVERHPHIYYVTQEWADNIAKGTPVKPLPLYYVIEGDDPLNMHYCDNQDAVREAVRASGLGLAPRQVQVFYVTRAQATALEKAGFHYQLSYLYVVVQGESELDVWCCDNQKLIRTAIIDSHLGPVPGAAPNVFYVTPAWKRTLEEPSMWLLPLRVCFPGDKWSGISWFCKDQRLIREAIRSSRLGRVPDGVTNIYYVTPEWKDRLEKADAQKEMFPGFEWFIEGSDEEWCWWDEPVPTNLRTPRWQVQKNRLLAEAIIDSGTKMMSSGKYYVSKDLAWRLVKETKAKSLTQFIRERDRKIEDDDHNKLVGDIVGVGVNLGIAAARVAVQAACTIQ